MLTAAACHQRAANLVLPARRNEEPIVHTFQISVAQLAGGGDQFRSILAVSLATRDGFCAFGGNDLVGDAVRRSIRPVSQQVSGGAADTVVEQVDYLL